MKKLYGNAIVGQSGGPTAAINATLCGVVRGVLSQMGEGACIEKLYGMRNGIEGLMDRRTVCLSDFFDCEEKLKLLEQTPAAALGSCRKKLPNPDSTDEKDIAFYEKLFAILEEYNIRYFFYIGGNDSMDTVAKMSRWAEKCGYEMRVMGVPKTIDNDLPTTDHTPGFGSAAKFIATVMQEIICDCAVYTTKAVTIVEIMGRDAGWLTASSAIGRVVDGRAPDLVYLPERSFDMEQFFARIEEKFREHPNLVVAVSEGLQFADGRYVGEGQQSGVADAFGHKYLSGTGKALEFAIKERFGCKVRSVELNLPQRCAGHLLSRTDIEESVSIGKKAVEAAIDGVSGEVMIFVRSSTAPYVCEISHEKVTKIANQTKYVPDEFINETADNVTDDCCNYLLPLIVGECDVIYNNGLPKHIIL
ncbi:MAG: 6-phosphofructokinase [Clostridia bacterium]|nr:6-phosphofructokinase [Clostridia bacterium]